MRHSGFYSHTGARRLVRLVCRTAFGCTIYATSTPARLPDAGTTVKDVQERLRHANSTMTLDRYCTAVPTTSHAAAGVRR